MLINFYFQFQSNRSALFEINSRDRYEVPRKMNDNNNHRNPEPSNFVNDTYESVCPVEDFNASEQILKRVGSVPTLSGPPPPPLPPPLKGLSKKNTTSINHNSNDSLNSSSNVHGSDIQDNFNHEEIESDSGMEVLEEPTLRPSELVRGNQNRSMSVISGET